MPARYAPNLKHIVVRARNRIVEYTYLRAAVHSVDDKPSWFGTDNVYCRRWHSNGYLDRDGDR